MKNDDDEEIYDGCDGRKKGMLKKKKKKKKILFVGDKFAKNLARGDGLYR